MVGKEELARACHKTADDFEKHPEIWRQYALATNRDNFFCSPLSPDATRWCALGRILKNLDLDDMPRLVEEQLNAHIALEVHGFQYLSTFNDSDHSLKRIIHVLRRFKGNNG